MSRSEADAARLKEPIAFPKYAALAGLVLCAVALTPLWVTSQYWMYLASISLVFGIIAIGLNITNGYLGVLNLAVAGQIGVGAYTCALLALAGVPVPLALVGAALIGAVISAICYLLLGRLEGFFFGLSTLAAGEIIRLLLRNLEEWTNGVRGLRGYPQLSDSQDLSFWILLATVVLLLVGMLILIRSSIGLAWRAIRENSMKAAASGIRVQRQKLLGYTIAGAIISLGGGYLALLAQYIDPFISDLKMVVQVVLMVALGGLGTIIGPVIGATIITLLPEVLRITNELRLIAYGIALIIVVLALPGGIVGAVRQMRRARRIRTRRI